MAPDQLGLRVRAGVAVSTLGTVAALARAADQAAYCVEHGDADKAIEHLQRCHALTSQALADYDQSADGATRQTEPAPPPARPVDRARVLEIAARTVTDREHSYGDPSEFFERVASLWSSVLNTEIGANDVPLCLAAFKLARLATNPEHLDSWVDLAGYAAIGGESALRGAL